MILGKTFDNKYKNWKKNEDLYRDREAECEFWGLRLLQNFPRRFTKAAKCRQGTLKENFEK